MIVAFACLPVWRGIEPPAPSSVKVFHVLEDGHPPRGRTDTRLPDVGIVTAFGEPVSRATCVCACEGVVRGLALAAREPGAVIAFDHPRGLAGAGGVWRPHGAAAPDHALAAEERGGTRGRAGPCSCHAFTRHPGRRGARALENITTVPALAAPARVVCGTLIGLPGA